VCGAPEAFEEKGDEGSSASMVGRKPAETIATLRSFSLWDMDRPEDDFSTAKAGALGGASAFNHLRPFLSVFRVLPRFFFSSSPCCRHGNYGSARLGCGIIIPVCIREAQ
jgi:hypothetical protein